MCARTEHKYQFSLRSLIVLVLLVSIGISCFAVRMQEARAQRSAVEAIEQAGGMAFYDYQINAFGKVDVRAKPSAPNWLHCTFGDDFFADIVDVYLSSHWRPDWEAPIGGVIDPTDPQAAESLAVHLGRLTRLESLRLVGSQFTDAWLKHLEGLTTLHELFLVDTKVTKEGVTTLQKALPECEIHRVQKL